MPWQNFADKLDSAGASGFGIIHWTTRPLDLYFKNLSEQVWTGSKNNPVESSVHKYAIDYLGGQKEADIFEKYMLHWIAKAPMFGRETTNHFIDPGTFVIGEVRSEPEVFLDDVKERLAIIGAIDKEQLSGRAREIIAYFEGMEKFFIAFIDAQQNLQASQRLLTDGKTDD